MGREACRGAEQEEPEEPAGMMEVFVWWREFKMVFECSEYTSKKKPNSCGLVEIDAIAKFCGEDLEDISVEYVFCLDDEKKVTLSEKDLKRARIYLEARAQDKLWDWREEQKVADGDKKWEALTDR